MIWNTFSFKLWYLLTTIGYHSSENATVPNDIISCQYFNIYYLYSCNFGNFFYCVLGKQVFQLLAFTMHVICRSCPEKIVTHIYLCKQLSSQRMACKTKLMHTSRTQSNKQSLSVRLNILATCVLTVSLKVCLQVKNVLCLVLTEKSF